MAQVAVPVRELRELELLIRAHHPLIGLETVEDERAEALLQHLADSLGIPYMTWSPGTKLRGSERSTGIYGTADIAGCLAHIQSARTEALYHLRDAVEVFDDPRAVSQLKNIYQTLRKHRGVVVFTSGAFDLPDSIRFLFTFVRLDLPSRNEYYDLVKSLLEDVRRRMPVAVDLDGEQVGQLLGHLQGLTLAEARQVMSRAMVDDLRLGADDLQHVLSAKQEIVTRSGLLEYYPTQSNLDEIAGLDGLKSWLSVRKAAFHDPVGAGNFGLQPPRGLLLVGVQGCGKSLCAKAVAGAWGLPLIRLDPGRLYDKYLGETEKNLARAIGLAERMAPIVLWIDEIEKALGPDRSQDSGASQRVLGSFLTWLQERKGPVFVIATSNDITRLPPELLRKGRFDEIFFVDLPDRSTRKEIIAVHLERRGRESRHFDLDALAEESEGFSGAEIEQAIVSALFHAYHDRVDLDTDAIAKQIATTVPLSVTMAEPISALRQWARGRTVAA